MLNKLHALREAAAKKQGSDEALELAPLRLDPGEPNVDRELVETFLPHLQHAQQLLGQLEACNKQIQEMANKLVYDRKDQ